MTSAAEPAPTPAQSWWRGGSRAFFIASVVLELAVLALWMSPDTQFIAGLPKPATGAMGLAAAATLMLVLWIFWRPPPSGTAVAFVLGVVVFATAFGAERAIRHESRLRQAEANMSVWYDAHCRDGRQEVACEQYLSLFQGSICNISRPENTCVRRIAPYLDEARARLTGATMP